MKVINIVTIGLLFLTTTVFSQYNNDWENPLVVQKNRFPSRSTLYSYPTEEQAKTLDREKSPWYQSLNGNWKFNWVIKPADAPDDFYKEDYDVSKWADIDVPSCWEMRGYGNATYVNSGYPFPKNPPFIDHNHNPVGSYKRTFNIPDDWNDKTVLINFGGVLNAYYLYVNGKEVGYNQGSYTSSEFDITKYLKPGKNTVAVKVYRWSDGAYLEDQDNWRMSGIFREVFLQAWPKVALSDLHVRTLLDDKYEDAVLQIRPRVHLQSKDENLKGYQIKAQLFDGTTMVLEKPMQISVQEVAHEWYPQSDNVHFALMKQTIKNPKKWSAEKPNLYTLLVTIEKDGKVIQATSTQIGFRQIDIKDGVLMVNGKRVIMFGVNRHDHSPTEGKTVSHEELLQDITILKQNNMNLIRTCHYPNDPYLYELCDKFGIYVMDEANLETHGMRGELSNSPEWTYSFLDRAIKMVERDKLHPSVLFWSLGNESGTGPNHAAMASWIKTYDYTRPIHSEGAQGDPTDRRYKKHGSKEWTNYLLNPRDRPYVDMISRMYATVEIMNQLAEDPNDNRPVFNCEFAHAMGNSLGNLKEYVDSARTHDNIIGGAIWDFIDQGITTKTKDGKTYWGYGNDRWKHFGADPGRMNFLINGIINPDKSPKPQLFECKKVFQFVAISKDQNNEYGLNIKNYYHFTNLNEFDFKYSVKANGIEILTGDIEPINLEPGKETKVILPINKLNKKAGVEYVIHISVCQKTANAYAKAGYEVAWEDFVLPKIEANEKFSTKKVSLLTANNIISGGTAAYKVTVDKATGYISSIKVGNKPVLLSALKPNFVRAATDNDRGQGNTIMHKAMEWKNVADDFKVETVEVKENTISVNGNSSFGSKLWLKYELFDQGIKVSFGFEKPNTA
ncbi:glycoside hydrolase family 2 TIM barrel-domain containing protein, partial [Flavobacterium sp.]|uniref:glycoside hydrolase family 2 TIM barrel-domain containing protein n=1 Tax=Flavobacterium sp. TaxID=239 RepID=UPI003C576330